MDLASSEDDSIRCAPPQAQVLATTLLALGSKSSVVLDLSAIATLRLLGITRQVLTTTAFRFVISPATFAEFQVFRGQSRLSDAHGMMYYEKGQHYFAKTTEEGREKQKAAFEEMMKCIEKNVNVVPVTELATLTPEKRKLLEQILGRYGLESALLALSPGYIWWSDDFTAGEVGRSELGVERVWTQPIIEHIANLGLIDRGVAEEAYAKLVGFNYDATHFTAGVMIAALRLSKGSVGTFPMRQMIQAFKPLPSTNRNAAFRLLAEFILRLTVEPLLPETKCVSTKALLNVFPGDTTTTEQLKSFRIQCARLMTLNPLAQADFMKCFDQWNKERSTLNYIVNP